MQEYYKILGISQDASDEEVETAYKTLKTKYSKERFLEGEEGNQAARNLTKLENAYSEIVRERQASTNSEKYGDLSEIEKLIKEGDTAKAQTLLDDYTERTAEWHYLQAVLFYKKNWFNESKKQLEIAIEQDPTSEKYKDAYTKLNQKMNINQAQFTSGNAQQSQQNFNNNNTQMGGDACSSCTNFCATWCCMEMLCSCLCGR